MNTQPTNNISSVLTRATDEQRGVEVDGRAIDAAVAEKVMGWKRVTESAPIIGTFPAWNDGQQIRNSLPSFTTDATADHIVLEHVRKTWTKPMLCEFAWQLSVSLNGRVGLHHPLEDSDSADCVMYESGDYSRAAMSVVTASPVPPCLAQQFPTASAIDRQKRETIERCEAAASEENAGERMTGERFDAQQ